MRRMRHVQRPWMRLGSAILTSGLRHADSSRKKLDENVRLSSCSMKDDGDFRKVIELVRSTILGRGARAARIGVKGTVLAGVDAELRLDGRCLEFEELELSLTGGKK